MASWYERVVFNALMDRALSKEPIAALRRELLAECSGEVVEVGFGTGLNLPQYPSAVRRVRAVVREDELDARALRRATSCRVELVHVRGDAQRLPFDDASVETLVCTFVLCSVADADRAHAEFARVLAPDGRLFVLEHILSPRRFERFVQRGLSPLQRHYACGCELDRDLVASLARAGFDSSSLRVGRTPALPFPAREVCRGTVRRGGQCSAST